MCLESLEVLQAHFAITAVETLQDNQTKSYKEPQRLHLTETPQHSLESASAPMEFIRFNSN